MYRVFSFVFFIALFRLASGQTMLLSEEMNRFFINTEKVIIYEDSTASLSFPSQLEQIKSCKQNTIGVNQNIHSAYWLKITIFNDTKEDQALLLEFQDPHISEIIAYQGSHLISRQGFSLPFSEKSVKHKNHLFDVNFEKGVETTLWIRTRSIAYHGFGCILHKPSTFLGYAVTEYFYLGLFYGFLIIMLVYNLTVYFFTFNNTRIYYASYVLAGMLVTFAEDGLGFQFFWSGLPLLNQIIDYLWPITYLFAFLMYARSFLKGSGIPFIIPFKYIVFGAAVMTCIYTPLALHNLLPRFWVGFMTLPIAIVVFESIRKYILGFKAVRFLIFGSILILISFSILFMRFIGLLENNIWQVYFFNMSMVCEVLLFSMALGEKIRGMQRDRIRDQETIIRGLEENEKLQNTVNRELEEKIRERTAELNSTKNQLEKQAQEINEMNLKLDLSNRNLQKKAKEISQKRIHNIPFEPSEFRAIYPDKLSCVELLEELKWESGFTCRKCGSDKSSPGSSFRSRRCTKCGTTETPTAKTIFHGLRIPIEDAFFLFALIVQKHGEISSTDLSKQTGIGQKACWNFKQKVTEVGKESGYSNAWNRLIFTSDN